MIKSNLILLPQLLPAICNVAGNSYFTKTMAQGMRCAPVYSINIVQGNVTTHSKYGKNFHDCLDVIVCEVC